MWILKQTFITPARVGFNTEAMAYVGSPPRGRAVEIKARLGDTVKKDDGLVVICIRGKVTEKDMFLIRWAEVAYEPVAKFAVKFRYAVVAAAVVAFLGSLLLFTRLGQEFVPTLDEKDIAMHAMRISSTSLTQSQNMQFDVERAVS